MVLIIEMRLRDVVRYDDIAVGIIAGDKEGSNGLVRGCQCFVQEEAVEQSTEADPCLGQLKLQDLVASQVVAKSAFDRTAEQRVTHSLMRPAYSGMSSSASTGGSSCGGEGRLRGTRGR